MFNYLIDKIIKAEFLSYPFTHLYIENFFSDNDFNKIVNSSEIKIPKALSDADLINTLETNGYKAIEFPGCITYKKKYLKWHKNRKKNTQINTSTEGFGMTLRLIDPKSEILKKLNEFLSGEDFNKALADKFLLNFEEVYADNGIQKYLDGYEISPHPDSRHKETTFMVNINPHKDSEQMYHHTQYCTLKKEYNYLYDFWKNNLDINRCWIPWDWAETKFIQTKNNSIVIFSPSDNTIHGVKTNYNHLNGQRTQVYGNLWKKNQKKIKMPMWSDLDLRRAPDRIDNSLSRKIKDIIPIKFKEILKKYI
jgi:hypothetical protein